MPGVAEFLTGGSVFNTPFARLLVQFLLITALSRAIGRGFTYIKEPMVIAETVAGIILGPTVLENWDWFKDNFFPSSSLPLLNAFANFGLVLFMFLVGCEIDWKLLRPTLKTSLATGIIGTAVCFGVTVPLTIMIRHYDCEDGSTSPSESCAADLVNGFVAFYLYLGVIISISALPVLARILTDFRILSTNLGVLTIATVTIEDFFAWPLLSISLAVAGATKKITIVYLFLLLLGDILVVILVVRPLLVFIVKYYAKRETLSHMGVWMLITVLIAVSFYAEIIGLSAFIGAFQVGLVMPRRGNVIGQISSKIEDITVVLFLPLFFASSGQKTDLKYINSGLLWAITICTILVSTFGKILGCMPPARFWAKFTWRESFSFGVLMNTKGLVALVSLNLGLSFNIITQKLFSMLVLMVIVNTLLTSPIVWFLNRGFFRARQQTERQDAADRANQRQLDKRRAMICLQPTLLTETLAIARLIFTRETEWTLLRIIETADKPSTYMGPLQKKLIKRDQTLRSALEFCKMIETVSSPKVACEINADFYAGVTVCADERNPDYVFLSVSRASSTHDQLWREMHDFTHTNNYTIVLLVASRSSQDVQQDRADRVEALQATSSSNIAQPHQQNKLAATMLRGEQVSVVFPYVTGADSEEALTIAIELAKKGVPVEVIQTAERATGQANEVLRRLFSGQSVSYRIQNDNWRAALGDSAGSRNKIALLPFSRQTMEYAMSPLTESHVLLVKAPHRGRQEERSRESVATLSVISSRTSTSSKESV